MQIYDELVFDQVVRGTTEVLSAASFNETLGKADEIVYEVEVEESSGGPGITITCRHFDSNSGKAFVAKAPSFVNGESIDNLPFRAIKIQPGPFASMGQVGVKLTGGTSPTARVRIWACGRVK